MPAEDAPHYVAKGQDIQPLVLKSAADAIISELQGLIVTHEICADKLQAENERLRDALRPVASLASLAALRRPAPTVEEVARVVDPAAFMFAPDELSKDADPRAPALEKAARIHALWTGEKG
jgi:hypothetical protein